MTQTHIVNATLWIWSAERATASWHFLTIEGDAAEAMHALALMRRMEGGLQRGWGSIKVQARIGQTNWETSLFPDKQSGGWLLPVKAAVRKAEGLGAGDLVKVAIAL